MTIIAAITKDNALGRGGDMIYHISADLKRFKQLTMGHPMIMGRRTLESFPKGPLPGRRNLVLTRDAHYHAPGVEVYSTLEAAIAACDVEPMVIGGGQVYAQAMPLADRLLITEIDAVAADADTHFPFIDRAQWEVTEMGEWLTDPRSSVNFRYITLKRVNRE